MRSKKNNIKKTIILIIAFILLISVLAVVNYLVVRNRYTLYLRVDTDVPGKVDVTTDRDDIVKITNISFDGKNRYYIVNMVKLQPGRVFLTIDSTDPKIDGDVIDITVNKLGIIYQTQYISSIGNINIVRIEIFLMLLALIGYLIGSLVKVRHDNFYTYRTMYHIGSLLFVGETCIIWLFNLVSRNVFYNDRVYSLYNDIVEVPTFFSLIAFPFIIIISIILFISNIVLLIKEGRSITNMFGIALGILLVGMTFFGITIGSTSGIFFNTQSIIGNLMSSFFGMFFFSLLTYLECILVGSYVGTVIAQRHIPSFNKDYIIILGCGIREDGTLTPLLKGRADRAMWFAEKQKSSKDKDIIYVASGGQGEDEIISEAQAIKNYLMERDIPEDRILLEDRSTTTYENMKLSKEIIDKNIDETEGTKEDIHVAFSTTGYHVFRSGNIANSVGVHAVGVGSRTKWYFYINALIREFIANIVTEKKRHIKNVILIALGCLAIVLVRHMFKLV